MTIKEPGESGRESHSARDLESIPAEVLGLYVTAAPLLRRSQVVITKTPTLRVHVRDPAVFLTRIGAQQDVRRIFNELRAELHLPPIGQEELVTPRRA